MNYTSDTHSAGFGVSSCSVLTLGKGLKAREEKSESETSFFVTSFHKDTAVHLLPTHWL